MSRPLHIYPECWADTFFARLITKRGDISHRGGINAVGNALKEQKDKHEYIIGLVDTDKFKRTDPTIEQFKEVVQDNLTDQKLLVLKIPGTQKHLIRLHPALEVWIWTLAVRSSIDPTGSRYGFQDVAALESATKTKSVYNHVGFRNLLKDIIAANPPAIQTVTEWLNKAVR